MPTPAPFSSPHNNPAFPALYLYPLNDSFIPKHISLTPSGQRIKIGRQTNAKTSPAERNGYFDSKVLSRQHAEVWEEGNKIFIKDVKSSNGTFINGERLSQEGLESEPYELKSDDIVEFGIDIVGEDNKTIIHHKVAARVSCVMNEQQAAMAARAEQAHQQQQPPMVSQPSAVPSSFNFAPGGPQTQQRRPQMPHPGGGLSGMGGMGGSMRPPGKSGLNLEHVLSRLQGELTKCRETGQDLQTLTGAMNEIQDTLGGSLPPNLPPYPHVLPPVRPPPPAEQAGSSVPPPPPENTTSGTAALSDLQSQLLTTQSSLATHVDKVRALESVFAEQEAIKQEVRTLRELVGVLRQGGKGGFEPEDADDSDDDSDARSIATVMPHTLERVDEEDEEEGDDDKKTAFRTSSPELEQDAFHEQEQDEEERAQRREELGRPRTPEPTNMGMGGGRRSTLRSPLGPASTTEPTSSTSPPSPPNISNGITNTSPPSINITDLTTRLTQLSIQLESALAVSETLQAQHAAAQSTISALEGKVRRLEGLVGGEGERKTAPEERKNDIVVDAPKGDVAADAESAIGALDAFRSSLQGQWAAVQDEWAQERARLRQAREEWEGRVQGLVDDGIKARFAFGNGIGDGGAFGHGANGTYPRGLATPPTPRSLSADSADSDSDSEPGPSSGRRRRRRRAGAPKTNVHASGSPPGSPVSDDDEGTELALQRRGLPTPEGSVYITRDASAPKGAAGDADANTNTNTAEVRALSPLLVALFFGMLIVSCCRSCCAG
ncbi:hypothetical protein C8J57DRAFT_1100759 [Mycena rebaudengoi]|nr:hypothetical protein C8J57DRAFT_1100759 [Mycena rebaudengoi]